MKKRNLVVANWKMNPETPEEAKKIFSKEKAVAKKLKNIDILICPPFPFISLFSKITVPKNMFLGAQDVSTERKGSFTGETSVDMIKNLGAKFVLVGHSERREMGESNETVTKKLKVVFDADLTPILCIGEKERDREGTHLAFIKKQIKECLSGLQKKYLVGIHIAYEPIWAIGRSYKEAMSPTDIHETVLYIKKVLSELFGRDIATSAKILYGGSVEPESTAPIMEYGDVNGLLVGHASLKPEQFSEILKASNFKR